MKTVLTADPELAAEFIRSGGLVAFPTETVYGLGADAFNEASIASIFEAKRRPPDNPLIAHIAERSQIGLLASHVPEYAMNLIDEFFPGPLTLVLAKQQNVPPIATAGLGSVGVRMPRSELAREFLSACLTPVFAPSANLSGRPSPTTWQAVLEDLDKRIDCILQGEATEIGLESTVLDCTGSRPLILREGAVTREQIERIAGQLDEFKDDSDTPKSPGMRHRHYSPRAKVLLVSGPNCVVKAAGFIGLNRPREATPDSYVHVSASVNNYAHDLFEFFRECDRRGFHRVYCEIVNESGIGKALMDRLRRAAESTDL